VTVRREPSPDDAELPDLDCDERFDAEPQDDRPNSGDETAPEASRRPPIVEPSEAAELVRRTLDGDVDAFENLVSKNERAIFNIAFFKSRNVFDAEDLTQDIFLAAYRALPSLKDHENFGGWLIGIAHNRCHKWYRRERTKVLKFKELREQKRRQERLELRRGSEPDEAGPRVSREIRELPHEIGRVLVLKYMEGLSYEAIEARLGITPYRIDYLIRKGKALLRRRLERRGGEA